MIQFRIRFRRLEMTRKHQRALRMFKDLKPEMEKTGDWALEDARKRLARRRSKVSIGRLIKSLKRRAFRRSVGFVSALAYAIIQQAGGEVRPNKRKWLAIGLRIGDQRAHVWPKHVSGKPGVRLTFIPVSAGKAYLLYTKLKKVKDQWIKTEEYIRWVLLKVVRIPARPFLVKSRALLVFMRKLIADRLDRENRAA